MTDNAEPDLEPVAIEITSQMGVLSDEQCVALLESTPIGRIGFLAGDQPLVMPVNYAWEDSSVVFRSLEGQKQAAAAEGQNVCFEVDHWDAAERTGWSILVKGRAREVTGWAEKEALEQIGLVPWAHDTWRPMWIRIEPTEITGRVVR
ncbi:MAG: pyridoxamine 5'-phosphate oxidase family protein [Acidimicrobiia bacterium]|nr:pyridoxamine 5'-phosphate oxidase family protein [Acidimicrobiia bacterium]